MFNLRLFTIVSQKTVKIVERLGKFNRKLEPGLHFLIPIIDSISSVKSLREKMIEIKEQTAITKDNVSVHIDGNLFLQITDPIKASYQIEDEEIALGLLAQTVMRAQIGKIKLDQLFLERNKLNTAIYQGVNNSSSTWGVKCLRYQIRNIDPPQHIKRSMQLQAQAERTKRKDILISQGKREATVNIQEGKKQAAILLAKGRAESILIQAEIEQKALQLLGNQLKQKDVSRYVLIKEYMQSYQKVVGSSKVTLLADCNEAGILLAAASMIARGSEPNESMKSNVSRDSKEKKMQSKQAREEKPEETSQVLFQTNTQLYPDKQNPREI